LHSIILLITKHAILENKDLFLLLGVILVLLLRNLVPFRKISVSFRLERRQVSAKFRDNKEQNSTNFVCITFAQYCTFGQHNPYWDANAVDCIWKYISKGAKQD